jgi:hypothetical protein
VIFLSKKNKQQDTYFKDNQGIASIKNQINESYQSGVIEDKLNNNKDIYTFNNQSK